MRKLISLLLAVSLLVVFTFAMGCQKKEEAPPAPPAATEQKAPEAAPAPAPPAAEQKAPEAKAPEAPAAPAEKK
jgi:hypothetical protein